MGLAAVGDAKPDFAERSLTPILELV